MSCDEQGTFSLFSTGETDVLSSASLCLLCFLTLLFVSTFYNAGLKVWPAQCAAFVSWGYGGCGML